ncbi:receptor-like protein 7 [Pistacia vera]|uniref:receptor-like protein 7 n=1 Tax=Pistacia vera TaxID=55513 RepID=UPI001263B007|nr:receptor-like protein 7 [Pistacia vera]
MMSWEEDYDCCSWEGVTCDLVTGHVIGLDLSCSWLSGNIPSNITLFLPLQLKRLNLAYNDFNFSQISSDFGQLTSLTHLNLSSSNFSGQIPSEVSHLSKLVSLDLSSNFYNENHRLIIERIVFDRLVQNLTVLTDLALDDVDMSAIVPSSLMNLSSSPTSLSLWGCKLQGNVPESIFRLPNLKILWLGGNFNLTGNFPKVNWSSPLKLLDVSDMSLSEQVPNSISNLVSLRELHLNNCTLVGSVPASLGNLTQLAYLSLYSNKFNGHIPSFLSNLAKLRMLGLSNNNFIGEFPDIFHNLTQLSLLSLSSNQLTGPIPSWLSTLPSLHAIFLDDNRLNGSIPSSIFELVNLTDLSLSSNNLTGIVELHLFSKQKNLQYLDLSHNSLSINTTFKANSSFPQLYYLSLSGCNLSEFPSVFKANWPFPQLHYLYLSGCKLSEFPSVLRSANQLVSLDLSDNKISGQIPNWMGGVRMDTLSYLNLSHNNLTRIDQLPWKNLHILDLGFNLLQGSIPIPPPFLTVLFFSNNKLTGKIPHMICNMSAIEILDLSSNSLSGKIPTCMGNYSNLHVLDLQKNKLYGTIPRKFAKGSPLRTLNINENELEGPIPRSLVNCTKLQVLDIGNNKVNDTFPYWLESLPELQVLVLHSNQFYGSVRGCSKTKHCFPKLKVFDLSNNKFGGPLPARYFENLNAMKDVGEAKRKLQYMGEDYYQDSITVTMKGYEFELVKIITAFTAIDFSNNNFYGEIPKVIGELHSLLHLNLSLNNLTGCIPSSLGNLNALESLDLSSNKLVERIPWQLKNLDFLGVLNLSQNQLTGPIPRAPHFDTFGNTSYKGNLGLCGFPLSKECKSDETLQAPSKLEDDAVFNWIRLESGVDRLWMWNGCWIDHGISCIFNRKASLDCKYSRGRIPSKGEKVEVEHETWGKKRIVLSALLKSVDSAFSFVEEC